MTKRIHHAFSAALLSLIGCYALVDIGIIAATLLGRTPGPFSLQDLVGSPISLLAFFTFKDTWWGIEALGAYEKNPAAVMLASPEFVQAHMVSLAKDILLLLLVGIAIYLFERKKRSKIQRILFYLAVPATLWFLALCFIL